MIRMIFITLAVAVAASQTGGCVIVVADEGIDPGWAGNYDKEWGEHIDEHDSHHDRGSALADDVQARIRDDELLEGRSIFVDERDGVVTLHGRVSDLSLVARALDVAESTPGVVAVVSRVVIER